MSKKTRHSGGTSLVIVESPAKARTIGKFLGPGYTIEASIGHIRDLPQGAKEIPAEYKGEDWAYLGVNVHKDFDPVYVIPRDKIAQVRKLKALLKGAKDLYLATDEDREGEAISWHLCEVLQPKVPVHRLVFHEITEEAIRQALEQPREIDNDLVRAQEVRRIVDRLYGYDVSPLLWRKIRSRLSAGRVQSVAVRLIVQRERQRMSFVSATYWDLLGNFAKIGGAAFEATLISHQGRGVPSSRDFDPANGKLKDAGLLLLDERQAVELAGRIARATCRVSDLDDKPYTTRPYPPFTTSTLQQEANRKYGFTARHTMQAAQSLYETGHITYMRTDSTNLAAVAVQTARQLVASQYGPEYLPDQPRYYQTKVKNAQEAHEAIRPAGHPFDFPEALRSQLSLDQFKLYDLIWKRTVASQMADARGRRITIDIEADGAVFQASGRTIDFPGYLRAYVEGSDDPESRLADRDVVLPGVTVGETLECRGIEPKSHTTQPPNRYSEASLTRALEEMGIGRPSTYAQIIDTILAREYVFKSKRGNVLVPTWTAFAVSQLLEVHLPNLVDYQFTAEMEDELDAISRGELSHLEYLKRFYFGNDHPGLKEQLKNKVDEINARDVSRLTVGKPEGQPEVFVRVGRYGPFLEQGDRHAAVPDNMPPEELTLAVALGDARQSDAKRRAAGHLPPDARAGLREGRPLRSLCPARHGRGRPEAAKRLAPERHERRRRDTGSRVAIALAAPHARRQRGRTTGGGLQRAFRPLCEVRRGNPLVARRAVALGRDVASGVGIACAAEDGRRPRRPQGAAEGLRSFARHGKARPVARGPLRALCDRRGDQRLAAAGDHGGGGHVGVRLESVKGPGRARAVRAVVARPPRRQVRCCCSRREKEGEKDGQEVGHETGDQKKGREEDREDQG